MRRFVCFLIAALLPLTAPAHADNNHRVFALLNPGTNSNTAGQLAALSQVDGLAFRDRWSKMESSSGVYDWSRLDAIASVAQQYNKPLTVHVGADLPSWLSAQGAVTYSYSHPTQGTVSTAQPWDAVMLERHKSFITALADHLKQKNYGSLLAVVSVAAPVPEMSLVECSNGVMSNGTSYDRGSYMSAWQTSIRSHSAAFSDASFSNLTLTVSAPVKQICYPDADGKKFYADLMADMRPSDSRLAAFMADLNAQGSARYSQIDSSRLSGLPLHFQTIWSYSDDIQNRFKGSMQQALCYASNAGAGYVELYTADIQSSNSSVQDAISAFRDGTVCSL